MNVSSRIFAMQTIGLSLGLAAGWACAFDNSLREYLYTRFWQPFAKSAASFAKPVPSRPDPFAGMRKAEEKTPLERLRAAYQSIAAQTFEEAALARAIAEARSAGTSLSRRDREEVDLIDAKIDLRLRGIPSVLSARKRSCEHSSVAPATRSGEARREAGLPISTTPPVTRLPPARSTSTS